MLGIGILELVCLYFWLCFLRWKYARHYGQGFQLMGLALFSEAWDSMRFDPHYKLYRVVLVLLVLFGVVLTAVGFNNGLR